MIPISQYDVDPAVPAITDREIRRRWAEFRGRIRMVSGNRLQQVLGRLFGPEDGLRYRLVRLVGRPVLRLVRRLRGTTPPARRTVLHLDVPDEVYFPVNLRENLLERPDLAPRDAVSSSITVVRIDESTTESRQVVDGANRAVRSATTDWVLLADVDTLEGDVEFAGRALLARAAEGVDIVYADEFGPHPHRPILKPPYIAPHTLLSYNVVGRPALVRRTTWEDLGGLRPDAGWAFEHDFYLRASEAGVTFAHVPTILHAGRSRAGFEASHIDGDTVRVVRDALERRGWGGVVTTGGLPGLAHWRPPVPDPAPRVDIVIPTRDRVDLMRRCIDSITARTTYSNYDIIILDNDSKDPETLAYFREGPYRVVPCPGPFNYAWIVNRGVAHSTADFVITLNNDTIVVTPDWIERLVAVAALPDVGFVGACLLDEDGQREHESIVAVPYPQHLRTDSNYPNDDHFARAVRDVVAVTGAIQMVRRDWWSHLGGMDEELKVTMNDVDICLRSQVEGRYVVYLPDVQLYHHVSSSRGSLDPLDDRNRFIRRWDIFGNFRDPYFPESLVLLGEQMYYRFR